MCFDSLKCAVISHLGHPGFWFINIKRRNVKRYFIVLVEILGQLESDSTNLSCTWAFGLI